jgi:hypothetical protein
VADPEFVVHTGDVVAHGGDQAEWNIWFDEAKSLLPETVFMPSIGNHEDNAPNYYQQFALPHNEDWYSFDYGNAHFIALTTEKTMTGNQRAWLEQDLASTNATWIFVYYHRPMYSSGSHGPERSVYRAWGDLFDKYHVDMVFNGHDHCYERTLPMANDWIADSPENGTIHIVTGGAGAPLYGMVAEGPWSAKFLSVNHFVFLTINGTELHAEARFYNQTVFDEFTISKAVLPDLIVKSLSISPLYPVPGGTTSIEIEVANSGKLASPGSRTVVKVDDEVVTEFDVGDLGPGDISKLSLSWDPLTEGYHDVEVTVDADNQIAEGIGEGNNDAGTTVLASAPRPDLVVGAISSDVMIPDVGEMVTYTVEVLNEGTGETGPFGVDIVLDNGLMSLLTTFNQTLELGPGDSLELDVIFSSMTGDWQLNVELDPGSIVDEIFENNNFASKAYIYRDFLEVGPAYLPQGFELDETVYIYYDQKKGGIPLNSTSCVAVWGINGWKKPPKDMAPADTATRSLFETEMTQVSEDFWLVAIPTDERYQWIDLKFADRRFFPRYWDDNGRMDWIIPGENWAMGKIAELLDAMNEAEVSGVDVLPYEKVLEEANLSLKEGLFLDAALLLANATNHCRKTECEFLLTNATAECQLALAEGLDVKRANAFLIAAQSQLDSGNYQGSKQYCLTSLQWINEAREKVPQRMVIPFVLVTTFSVLLFRQRSRGERREH